MWCTVPGPAGRVWQVGLAGWSAQRAAASGLPVTTLLQHITRMTQYMYMYMYTSACTCIGERDLVRCTAALTG